MPTRGNNQFKNKVEQAGAQIIEGMLRGTTFPQSMANMSFGEIANNTDFLHLNTSYCIAHVAKSGVLEVYRDFAPHQGHGYIELVAVVPGVKQLPPWRHIRVQVSQVRHRCLSCYSRLHFGRLVICGSLHV